MSLHSYSRCWLHLTWATLRRERMLPKPAGLKVSSFLYDYSRSKGIYMKSNYVNPDHTHAVIDLPTSYSIEKVLQLLKGASSNWINSNRMIAGKFSGDAATVRSRFRTRIWTLWCATSRIRRNITGGRRLLKSFRRWLRFTGWNGTMTRLTKLSR